MPKKRKAKAKGKRKYQKGSVKLFFDRMEAGTLRVDIESATVERLSRKGEWIPIIPFETDKGYLYVRAYLNGARFAIALHRLVWMVANGEESIEEGAEIHHADGDRRHNNYRNLDKLDSPWHRKAHECGWTEGEPSEEESIAYDF